MHNQRIALIISSVIGVIATFLPFMKSWFHSVSLIETSDGTGYIVIITFTISLIVALFGNHQKALIKGYLAGALISGSIPGALLLLFVLSRLNDDFAKLLTKFEIGFYLVVFASLAILLFGLLIKDQIVETSLKNTDHESKEINNGLSHNYIVDSDGGKSLSNNPHPNNTSYSNNNPHPNNTSYSNNNPHPNNTSYSNINPHPNNTSYLNNTPQSEILNYEENEKVNSKMPDLKENDIIVIHPVSRIIKKIHKSEYSQSRGWIIVKEFGK